MTWESGWLNCSEIQESKYCGWELILPLFHPFFPVMLWALFAGLKLVFSFQSIAQTYSASFRYPSHSSSETGPLTQSIITSRYPHSLTHFWYSLDDLCQLALPLMSTIITLLVLVRLPSFVPLLPTVSHSLPFLPVSFHCLYISIICLPLPPSF